MPPPSNDFLQAHIRRSEVGDIVSDSKHEVKARLQDFAFLQGFAFVVGSSDPRPGRYHCTEYRCHHHGSKTRNYRGHTDNTRQRQTHAGKLNCPMGVVVKDLNQGRRVITTVEWAHTHDPHPNPLILDAHRSRQPGVTTATTFAQSHRELLSYSRSAEVIRGEGLKPLSSKEYYNLRDKAEKGGTITDVEEYHLIGQTLHHSDWRHRICSINIINDVGEAERRVLQDIFCSSEHITLARRFVNDFYYVTDATFNTNRRHLPLAILTGITNC